MSRNVRIFLYILAGLVVSCLFVCGVGAIVSRYLVQRLVSQMITTDPTAVAAGAKDIVDFTLPAGYREGGLMNILNYRMLMVTPDASVPGITQKPVFLFMQLPLGSGQTNSDQIRQQMQSSLERSMGRNNLNMRLVGSTITKIRGQDVVLSDFEGTDGNGRKIMMIMSDAFNSKSGTLWLMIMGPAPGWSDMEVNWFIGSIR